MISFAVMNAEYLIKIGRQHFTALMGVVILLSIVNTIYEVIFGVSYGILFTQLGILAILGVLTWAVLKGFRMKNLLMASMLFIGIFTFYQAGTRTPDLRKSDMGAIPLVTLVLGLAIIFGAIYLSYSTEIKAFLDQKIIARDRIKAKKFE